MENETMIAFGGNLKTHVDGDTGWVEGLGVMYGNEGQKDLEGDFFTANTFYGHAVGDNSSATLNHGIPMYGKNTKAQEAQVLEAYAKRQFKSPIKTEQTDIGILARHALDLKDEYESWVFEQTQNGTFKWSSGALAHLVERDDSTGEIKRWEIGEFAYTPSPAEHRLPPITPLKSYQAAFTADEIKTETIQETAEETGAPVDVVSDGPDEETKSTHTGEIMTEEVKATPAVDPVLAAVQGLSSEIKSFGERVAALEAQPVENIGVASKSVNYNKIKESGSEAGALKHFIRTGETNAYIKASNDTDMNVGTAADGGSAVPTGHFNGIIARRDESMIANMVGVRNIPGEGMTVNVPLDAEDDGEFILTSEAASTDRDAPALGTTAMTLGYYTKRVELSHQLINSEESRLIAFLDDFIGRGMAKTHNSLLVTEVSTNGTNFNTFASTTAIADGELEALIGNDNLDAYLDDAGSVAWITRPSTHAAIRAISGSDRKYDSNPQGSGRRSLLGYDMHYSNKVDAPTTGNQSILFGNFNYVGFREAPGLTFLRDPYSKASNGQVVLHYYFSAVYKVLQAEAVGFGQQA